MTAWVIPFLIAAVLGEGGQRLAHSTSKRFSGRLRFCSRSSAAGSGAIAFDHPLPTGRVVYEMAVMMTRQERHFEPSMCRVLGANKKPKAESADGESPSRGIIATPMADEPSDYEGDQPDATNPHKVMPHRRI
jgi:hypothetical protein